MRPIEVYAYIFGQTVPSMPPDIEYLRSILGPMVTVRVEFEAPDMGLKQIRVWSLYANLRGLSREGDCWIDRFFVYPGLRPGLLNPLRPLVDTREFT